MQKHLKKRIWLGLIMLAALLAAVGSAYAGNTYTITVSSGQGTTDPPSGDSGSVGGSKTITMTPASGWHVAEVTVNNVSVMENVTFAGNVGTYVLDPGTANNEHYNVEIIFRDKYRVDIQIGSDHARIVDKSDYSNPADPPISLLGVNEVTGGSNLKFYIILDPNWHIDAATDTTLAGTTSITVTQESDIVVSGVTYEVFSYTFSDISADHICLLSFYHLVYEIDTIFNADRGTIAPNDPEVAVGADQEFTVTAKTGWYVTDILVDDTSTGEDFSSKPTTYTYTFNDVLDDHKIEAVFGTSLASYTVTASVNGNGTIGIKDAEGNFLPSPSLFMEGESVDIVFSTTDQANTTLTDNGTDVTASLVWSGNSSTYPLASLAANHVIVLTIGGGSGGDTGGMGETFCDTFDAIDTTKWNWVDLDNTASGTAHSATGGELSITAGGTNVWDNGNNKYDHYAALYLNDIEGDFEATVRVTSQQTGTTSYRKAGIMVKNDMTKAGVDNGSYALIVTSYSGGEVRYYYDSDEDGYFDSNNDKDLSISDPRWLRVVKTSNDKNKIVIYFYYSDDSNNPPAESSWTLFSETGIGSEIGSLQETQDIGLFVCASASSGTTTAKFDNFCLRRTVLGGHYRFDDCNQSDTQGGSIKDPNAAYNGTAGEVIDGSGLVRHGKAIKYGTNANNYPKTYSAGKTCRDVQFIAPSGAVKGYGAIEVPGNVMNRAQRYTFACWFKPTAYDKFIMTANNQYGTSRFGIRFLQNEIRVYDKEDWGGYKSYTNGINVQLNQWNHIAVVRRRDNIRVYFNGTPTGNGYGIDGDDVSTVQTIVLGKPPKGSDYTDWGSLSNNTDYAFLGEMDEVFLIRKSLKESEVTNIYNGSAYYGAGLPVCVDGCTGISPSTTTTVATTSTTVVVTTTTATVTTTTSASTTTVSSTSTTTTTTIPPESCLDIEDVPIESKILAAPANIMFVLDDSGSMDWEMMTTQSDGKFGGSNDVTYLYGTKHGVTDNEYGANSTNFKVLPTPGMWKSQWYNYNFMYYNPTLKNKDGVLVDYNPWLCTSDMTYQLGNANIDFPSSNPLFTGSSYPKINLDLAYFSVLTTAPGTILDNENPIVFSSADSPTAWTTFTVEEGQYEGLNYLYTYTKNASYKATWTPLAHPNLAPGTYKVYAKWRAKSDRSTAVKYTITPSAGGTSYIATVNQRLNGGIWNKLTASDGTDTFTFDDTGTVVLAHATTGTGMDRAVADALKFVEINAPGSVAINVPVSHYFITSSKEKDTKGNDKVLLVMIYKDGSGQYIRQVYEFNDGNNNATVEDGELSIRDVTTEPFASDDQNMQDALSRTAAQDRQNFANWFSYHRRRYFTTVYAVGRVLMNISGVNVGYGAINALQTSYHCKGLIQPVLYLDSNRGTLLDVLYSDYKSEVKQASTPLRSGFREVCRYFNTAENQSCLGTSPITESCQQNYAIVFSDGYYNGGAPGYQNEDDKVVTIPDPDNVGQTLTISGIDPFQDSSPNTLADVAMYYYFTDLAPALTNDVMVNEFDKAQHQHIVTYAVSFGVYGNLDQDDYYPKPLYMPVPEGETAVYPTWPNINSQADYRDKIDDMWHASVNGRGEFLQAGNPEELYEAFLQAILSISKRIGKSAAVVSVSGEELKSGENVFQSKYTTKGWSGDVYAYDVSDAGQISTSGIAWQAGRVLEEMICDEDPSTKNCANNGWTTRIIGTYTGAKAIPFKQDNLAIESMLALLDSASSNRARAMVDYLRGDKSNEQRKGGTYVFRDRITDVEDRTVSPTVIHRNVPFTLGDVIHSTGYFYKDVLYVGANDGMLHAFLTKAKGSFIAGQELFAYIPRLVYDKLPQLADTNYTHKYSVNGSPYVEEIGDPTTSTSDTILVCGFNKGGRGYFALDITDIFNEDGSLNVSDSSFTCTPGSTGCRVRWEFPQNTTLSADKADMGYSYSKPYVVKSNLTESGKPVWVVIFGNGYDSYTGHAVLFILHARTGAVLKRIDTGVGNCNGLSSAAPVDTDEDNRFDYVYAGDLKGNMWKFDIKSSSASDWSVAYDSGTAPKPLFEAGSSQPITTEPSVVDHCEKHGSMVLFGTGKLFTGADIPISSQSIYGIWDFGDDADDTEYLGTFNKTADPDDDTATKLSNLPPDATLETNPTLLKQVAIFQNDSHRVLSENNADWETVDDATDGQKPNPKHHAGWYFDLPDTNERVIAPPLTRQGLLYIVSFVPKSQVMCTTGSGYSWVHAIDPCTGARAKDQGEDQTVWDTDKDGDLTDADNITVEIPNPDYDPNDPDSPETIDVEIPVSAVRKDEKIAGCVCVGDKCICSGEEDPETSTVPWEGTGFLYWLNIDN